MSLPNPTRTHPPISPQSLALVTAKEPLRIAVANNLRTLLTNQLDANTLEQVGRRGVGWQGALLHHMLWHAHCSEGSQPAAEHCQQARLPGGLPLLTHSLCSPCLSTRAVQVVAMLVADNLDLCCQVGAPFGGAARIVDLRCAACMAGCAASHSSNS